MTRRQYTYSQPELVPTTILCPAHGLPIVLVVLSNGNKQAVCTCDVKPNKHRGLVVYEELPKE